jgi:hypothetical protein
MSPGLPPEEGGKVAMRQLDNTSLPVDYHDRSTVKRIQYQSAGNM